MLAVTQINNRDPSDFQLSGLVALMFSLLGRVGLCCSPARPNEINPLADCDLRPGGLIKATGSPRFFFGDAMRGLRRSESRLKSSAWLFLIEMIREINDTRR